KQRGPADAEDQGDVDGNKGAEALATFVRNVEQPEAEPQQQTQGQTEGRDNIGITHVGKVFSRRNPQQHGCIELSQRPAADGQPAEEGIPDALGDQVAGNQYNRNGAEGGEDRQVD